MRFWPRKAVEEPEIVVLPEAPKPGQILLCDDPKNVAVKVEPPADPPPDLSTKPEDLVGYCFGYVCPKRHVNETFENITVDGLKERRACQTCGELARPAAVKRFAEANWVDVLELSAFKTSGAAPRWSWCQYDPWLRGISWSRYEFLHYLDKPKPKPKGKE